MEKVDYKKAWKHLYAPSAKEPALVDVPEMHFLMVDGAGDPNHSAGYQQAVEALYAVSYALKFMVKKRGDPDYSVLPLEGLWWMEDMAQFSMESKNDWQWTMMIAQPEAITKEDVAEAVQAAKKKKGLPALDQLRFAPYAEGLCAQIMHIGPYSAEPPTIARLHAFIAAQGYALTAKHHEIYLSDPRRAAPEKMQTILRQPVKPK
jgi:hypothetical protein